MKIFPVRTKKPLTPNGLYDAREYADHWSATEYAEHTEWGAPCGAENGFWVVDVDKQHGGLATAAQFDWGQAFRLETPSGGHHLFYKYEEETCSALRNGVAVLPGIDVRSTGGYVVLYGEVDPSLLYPAPEWLFSLLKKPTKRLPEFTSDEDGVGEGGRNAYLARAAGRMQGQGILTLAALSEINERKCSPPLDEAEVEAVYHSILRYQPESTPADDPVPPKKIVWANELVGDFLEYIRDKGKVQGDPTGIDELDALLGGGKRLGELTVTAAEAKSGKNTLWHFLQKTQLDRGIQIGYASRELTPETEVLPNLLTIALNKNLYKAEDLTEEELVKAMRGWKLAFAPGYGAFHGNELFDWMDECRAFGVLRFYIDHLHYCLPNSEDFQQVAELGRKLKTYAKTYGVHIDLIIQPKGLDPSFPVDLDIHHIRGGASLGQVLDNLITLQRQRDNEGNYIDVTKVTLKRSRSKLAKTGSFYMQYDRDLMTFQVVEKAEAPSVEQTDDVPVADRGRIFNEQSGMHSRVQEATRSVNSIISKRITLKN
jgi:hypothetical protein